MMKQSLQLMILVFLATMISACAGNGTRGGATAYAPHEDGVQKEVNGIRYPYLNSAYNRR
jgi:hypothetical protein